MPVRPSRRLVLTAALTLSSSTLAGCGVRLEDDAPDIPFVPKREPIPGESALLALLGALETGDVQHSSQRAHLLRKALQDAQVPAGLVAGATSPTTPAEVAAAFEASVRECGPGLLRLVGQLTATQRILSPIGDKAVLWTAAGDGAWTAGKVATTALDATRATMYALEVVAGQQSTGAVAKAALTASHELQALSIRQTTAAGDSVQPLVLGYDRPEDVAGDAGRDWVVGSFIRLQAAYADCFARLDADRDAALEVTQWMVTAEEISHTHFPQIVPTLFGDGKHQP
ncbi:hypothetical protein [Janibacter sp. Soil728]|uniref:hypothetical protein n=1 Tax=Janibacter sp. Soil728 TaxID=1736393 RepID=UPI0012E775A6|nr:hypothetical protein [Janibacter sp. Soil728]